MGCKNSTEDEQIQEIVRSNEAVFATVKKIFDKLTSPIISDIISSELDADRFDYLLRDSLMTGVHYANLDLTWILRCLVPARVSVHGTEKNVLALDARRGTSVVEAYVLGRHYMYKHVYYHKTTRAAEQMLRVALQSAIGQVIDKRLDPPHEFFKEMAEGKPTVRNYVKLDDFLLLGYVDQWAERSDDLGKLCSRLRQRQIFKTFVYGDDIEARVLDQNIQNIRELAKRKGFNPELFVILDDPSDIALKSPEYLRKRKESKYQPLYFVEQSGNVFELAQIYSIIVSVASTYRTN